MLCRLGPAGGVLLTVLALGASLPVQPPGLLVVTHAAGFQHEVVRRPAPTALSLTEETLAMLGRRGGFQIAFLNSRAEVAGAGPEAFGAYRAVLFFTTGDLPFPPATRQALFRFVEDGGGFIGVHSATDTWPGVAEYGRMLGGVFDGHPWDEAVRLIVEDRDHPATRHLGTAFEIAEEVYQFKHWSRREVHVLLRLDQRSVDLTRGRRTDGDYALAWWRRHARGRVFYTALGHRPATWRDHRFQDHLLGAIRWAMGMASPP